MNLQNGIASLRLVLPANCRVGDNICFLAEITDRTRNEPFKNTFIIHVKDFAEIPGGEKRGTRQPPGKKEGKDKEIPSGIQLPKITQVFERDWEIHYPKFDKFTALRIKNAGPQVDDGFERNGGDVYDFFVNMDNFYLKSELKSKSRDTQISMVRFELGLVLLGLALLQQEMQITKSIPDEQKGGQEENGEEKNIEERVEAFGKAVAPILLPMIEHLGALDLDED
jgi:hypothetical protein